MWRSEANGSDQRSTTLSTSLASSSFTTARSLPAVASSVRHLPWSYFCILSCHTRNPLSTLPTPLSTGNASQVLCSLCNRPLGTQNKATWTLVGTTWVCAHSRLFTNKLNSAVPVRCACETRGGGGSHGLHVTRRAARRRRLDALARTPCSALLSPPASSYSLHNERES
jgi:hypothetical protein